jgi:O-antigen chain-terminating methyltransferase
MDGLRADLTRDLAAGLAQAAAQVEAQAGQKEELHREFSAAMAAATDSLQERFWQELRLVRAEYEKLIHDELRTVRQRAAIAPPVPAARVQDNLRFAEVFRGSCERVRASLGYYVPHFAGCRNVLDIGCGRGEFLAAAGEAGVGARGIDLDAECVALTQAAGCEAEVADLFEYLAGAADRSLDGILAAHIVEHMEPARLPVFIELAARKLASGALLAIETPNPHCLATFATYFYADPTHVRPVPADLLAHYLREAGFGLLETVYRQPAVELFPSLASLPEAVREDFFGAMDYAILARRL